MIIHFAGLVYFTNSVTAPEFERVRSSCPWLNCTLGHTEQLCGWHVVLIPGIRGCIRSKPYLNSEFSDILVIYSAKIMKISEGFFKINHHKQKNKRFPPNARRITSWLTYIPNLKVRFDYLYTFQWAPICLPFEMNIPLYSTASGSVAR